LFFLTCLGLNLLALHGRNEQSILDAPVSSQGPAPKAKAPAPVVPAGPSVPKPQ
jgi:hypothetical protein